MLPYALIEDVLSELKFFTISGHFLWCLYVIVNHGFRKFTTLDKLWNTNTLTAFLMTILSWVVALWLFAISMICLLPFVVCKISTVIILRILYKDNYGGGFQSADVLWVVEDKTAYNIINLLMLLKFDNSNGNLLDFVKDLCRSRFFKAKRMTSLRKFFLGYGYFLYNQLSAEEVVSSISLSNSGICNEEGLKEFVEKYANEKLPRNNSAACQIVVLEDRVDLGNEEDGEQYAILLRVHHTVCDGITLMSMMSQNISDEKDENQHDFTPGKNERKYGESKDRLRKFYCSHAHLHTLLARKDKNILKTWKLSGQKKIAFKIERKDSFLLDKVKTIKKLVPNSVFTTVLLTAISESLYDFFKNNSNKIPKDLILTFMAFADRNQLHFQHKELKNIFSMGSIRLPVGKYEDIVERLEKIIEEYQKFNNSCDIWVHYWQLKTFSNLLPRPLVKFIINLNDVTSVSFSNLPGIKRMSIDGHPLNHMMFWVPNFVTIGVGFSLLTYDDRFQMGFCVDEHLISDREKVQEVLDNVFVNIHKLYDSVCERTNKTSSNGNNIK